MREKTINAIIYVASAMCFALSFVLDVYFGIENIIWDVIKLILVITFSFAAIIVRGIDHEKSGKWFNTHKFVQGIIVCLACIAFGVIITTILF